MIRSKLKNLIKDKSGVSLIYVFVVGTFLILITGSLVLLSSVTSVEFIRKQKVSQLQLYAQSFVQTLNVALNKDGSDLAKEIILRMYQDNDAAITSIDGIDISAKPIERILTDTTSTETVKKKIDDLNDYLESIGKDKRTSVPLKPVTANISMYPIGEASTNGLMGSNLGAVQISDATMSAPTFNPTTPRPIKFYIQLKDETQSDSKLVFDLIVPIRIEIISTGAGQNEVYTANARFNCTVFVTLDKDAASGKVNDVTLTSGDWNLVEFE